MKGFMTGLFVAALLVVGYTLVFKGGLDTINDKIVDWQIDKMIEALNETSEDEGIPCRYERNEFGEPVCIHELPFGLEIEERIEYDRSEFGLGL